MSKMIPIYLSHSYRAEDREINQELWEHFWEHGFTFTVDPKSSEHLSIPHLELMMQRSAGFVAIAPYRPDQERYRTSPYIVFEHNMAVRARKPMLVLAESHVSGRPFGRSRLCVFRREDPAGARDLSHLVAELKEQSVAYTHAAERVLGSVGLVLPPGKAYDGAAAAIQDVLEEAGYVVERLPFDASRAPNFGEIDRHDFFVVDVRASGILSGLYYRFVPTIRLDHDGGSGRTTPLNSYEDEALRLANATSERVLRWSSTEQLIEELRPLVDKMQRPRREFRSREEGVGYFRSLGRMLQGPVFISNANGQNEVARQLSRALDLNNIAFFHYRYKNPIPMGAIWEGEVLRRLKASGLFVALITADYLRSDMCRQELKLALQLAGQNRLRLYRYLLDGTVDRPAERMQATDLTGMRPEDQIEHVVRDVDTYLTLGQDRASAS